MYKLLFLILTSFLLVACSSGLNSSAGGPKANKEQDFQAKQFDIPTDGTSNLYIYRNEALGGFVNMNIRINNQNIAVTGPQTYIFENLPAGSYKIEGISVGGDSTLYVELLPNTQKFIWQEVKFSALGTTSKLQEVSESEGKSGVLESSLLASNPYKSIYNNYAVNPPKGYIIKSNYSKPKKFKKRHVHKNHGSSCSCGYGYCYGPRGGRFCITSGGNKRYL